MFFYTKYYVNFLDCEAALDTPLFDNTEALERISCWYDCVVLRRGLL